MSEVGEFADGVYDVVQLPDDKVQNVGLNVPELPSLHVTLPPGVFIGVE